MKVVLSLSEAMHRCNDWGKFCREFGWDEYACAEGGSDIDVTLTEEEALRHGIIHKSQ